MEKCVELFKFMNVGLAKSTSIKDMFRLGKKEAVEEEGRCRPVKVKFSTSATASAVTKESNKLKDLADHTIYVKPDKTKSEQAEYKRLGARKEELLKQYNNDRERVKLEKGVIKVDGIEVDKYKSVQSLF